MYKTDLAMKRPHLLLTASIVSFALAAACGQSAGTSGGSTTVDAAVPLDTTPLGETTGDDAETLPDAVDVFADQPPYAAHAGSATSRKSQHSFHIPTLTDYSKSDCGSSGCHDGSSTNPEAFNMLVGGTVYWIDDLTPARGVEVRLKDATGAGYSVYSDIDGVFYVRMPTGMTADKAWPAHTGARAGTDDVLMSTEVKQVGCNAANCHDGSAAYPVITVPRPSP
jgi:hypothetical protein